MRNLALTAVALSVAEQPILGGPVQLRIIQGGCAQYDIAPVRHPVTVWECLPNGNWHVQHMDTGIHEHLDSLCLANVRFEMTDNGDNDATGRACGDLLPELPYRADGHYGYKCGFVPVMDCGFYAQDDALGAPVWIKGAETLLLLPGRKARVTGIILADKPKDPDTPLEWKMRKHANRFASVAAKNTNAA